MPSIVCNKAASARVLCCPPFFPPSSTLQPNPLIPYSIFISLLLSARQQLKFTRAQGSSSPYSSPNHCSLTSFTHPYHTNLPIQLNPQTDKNSSPSYNFTLLHFFSLFSRFLFSSFFVLRYILPHPLIPLLLTTANIPNRKETPAYTSLVHLLPLSTSFLLLPPHVIREPV